MQFLIQLFNFYLKASIHVALAVVSLAYLGAQGLNIPFALPLAMALFFGSIVGYNFIKYGVGAQYYIKVSKKEFAPVQKLSFVAAIFGTYGLYYLPPLSYFFVALMVIFTGLYALPMLPKKKSLRAIAGIKIYIVAGVWAMASVCLPLSVLGTAGLVVKYQSPEGFFLIFGAMALFLAHFFLVLVLMVPFEIRDWITDLPALKTIAQKYGVHKAQKLGYVWVFVFLCFQYTSSVFLDWPIKYMVLQLFLALVLCIGVHKSQRPLQPFYFTNFWVEAIPIGYALGWFLISYL